MGHVGEVIHVDEQDVAYEVEVEDDGELACLPGMQEEVVASYYDQETDIPSTSNSDPLYNYVPVHGDRLIDEHGYEYIFDESTQLYQQIIAQEVQEEPPKLPENIIDEEEEEVEEEEEEVEEEQPGPSTSTNNVYMIKRGGKRKYPEKIPGKLELYNPIAFTTSFSESLKTIKGNSSMKKLVKYSQMNTMHPDEVEQVVESGQIMAKLQNEITKLRKDNEKLRRENEEVHRRLTAVTGKHVEARQNNHNSNMVRKELQRHLNSLRQTRKDLFNTTSWE